MHILICNFFLFLIIHIYICNFWYHTFWYVWYACMHSWIAFPTNSTYQEMNIKKNFAWAYKVSDVKPFSKPRQGDHSLKWMVPLEVFVTKTPTTTLCKKDLQLNYCHLQRSPCSFLGHKYVSASNKGNNNISYKHLERKLIGCEAFFSKMKWKC